MGILNKIGLGKKDKAEEKPAAPVKQEQAEAPKVAKKTTAQISPYILQKPLVSEKAMSLAHNGKYVFAVNPRSNKTEIRKSIQQIFDVHITDVKIIKLPGKKRRYGRASGQTSPLKKAIVTLKEGENIPGIIESVG